MKYEQIKLILLVGLIGLSVVLTWKLYTFQPDIALLDQSERYIESESVTMGEEKRLAEIIVPEQIVVHVRNQYGLIPREAEEFTHFYKMLLGASFEKGNLSSGPFPKSNEYDGIEVIFPTPIPTDVFLSLFQLNSDEVTFPSMIIDRLFLYLNRAEEVVMMQVLSSEEERVAEVKLDLSISELEKEFMNKINEYPEVEPIKEIAHFSDDLHQPIYIRTEPVMVKKMTYATRKLSGDLFRRVLFTDPNSYKYFQQANGEDSYTDGNRIIMMKNNGFFMDYGNPVFTETLEKSSKHIIQAGYEFINGHGGWTDDYVLANWTRTDTKDEAEYRLHIGGRPVLSFEGADQMVLRTERSGNLVIGYTRPLIDIDTNPIDRSDDIELPSGSDVLAMLEQGEYFEYDRLTKMMIGYEMTVKASSFVTIEPHWFIQYGNRWQKVSLDEEVGI